MIGQSLSNTNKTCYSVQVTKIYNLNKTKYRYVRTGHRYSCPDQLAQKPLKKTKITTTSLAIVHTIRVGELHRRPSPAPKSPEAAQIWRSPIAKKL